MGTGEDYRANRVSLGLSVPELAARLDVTRKTIHMRESGKTTIHKEAWQALELLALQSKVHPVFYIKPRKKHW